MYVPVQSTLQTQRCCHNSMTPLKLIGIKKKVMQIISHQVGVSLEYNLIDIHIVQNEALHIMLNHVFYIYTII